MGQVLHGSATTTVAVRGAMRPSQDSLRFLAKRCGVNQKTVAKWRRRSSVAEVPTGPKDARSTVLAIEEEAIIVAFRRRTPPPLDDCLYALQATIPHLTRSSLHRCFQRHGISQLAKIDGEASARRGRLPSPLDRRSSPQGPHGADRGGAHFTDPRRAAWSPAEIKDLMAQEKPFGAHAFECARARCDIDHRLTKPRHPWTNGQVERTNRTIKEATVKRRFYERHDELRSHLAGFVTADNSARRLKALKGLTPHESICRLWTKEPQRFNLNPLQQMPGLNS